MTVSIPAVWGLFLFQCTITFITEPVLPASTEGDTCNYNYIISIKYNKALSDEL